MKEKIYGMSAPHMRGHLSSTRIMQYMILALIPAGIYGVVHFGMETALTIASSCAAAVLIAFLFEKIMKKPVSVMDCRVLLAGLLTAYCLPAGVEWYIGSIGGAICGLLMQLSLHFFGKNVLSPVILTRVILSFAFTDQMTLYTLDGLTMATPLSALKTGGTVDTLYMIFGNTGGCIGETSTILLCIGAIFLIMMGLIDFRVTGMYLFTFSAFMAVFGGYGLSSYYLTAHLAGGGFMLALWFIAPDYSTIPITKGGRWLYGIVLGLFTGFFRLFGPNAENICFAILLANLCVPLIEKITIRRPFGVEKGRL